MPEAAVLAARSELEVKTLGFEALPLTLTHPRVAGALNIPHNDPFDRMLIAQSLVEKMTLVSNETIFDRFGVSRLW